MGLHTYPDCGEPLMVEFIAAWEREVREVVKAYAFRSSLNCLASRIWKVQHLENHTEASMLHSYRRER